MQKFIIDLSKYNVLSKINQGGFSNVYMVEDKFTKEKYAAKILSTTDYEESNKTMINREISIMMRLQHPTFIHFYGYSLQDFYSQNRVTIIMSLAKNGSLATILQKNINRHSAWHDVSTSKPHNTSRSKAWQYFDRRTFPTPHNRFWPIKNLPQRSNTKPHPNVRHINLHGP